MIPSRSAVSHSAASSAPASSSTVRIHDRARVDRVGAARVQPRQLRPRRQRHRPQPLLQRRDVAHRDRRLAAVPSLSARSTPASADAVPDANATKSKPIARMRAMTGSSSERTRSASCARSRDVGGSEHGQLSVRRMTPELQRRREVQLLRVGEDRLERATAEIEQRDAALAQVERAARAQIDEPRLLVAADDANVDACLVARRAHELAAVLRLAHGAGRDRHQRVDVVPVGDAPQRAQRIQAAAEHLGRDDAECAGSSRPSRTISFERSRMLMCPPVSTSATMR